MKRVYKVEYLGNTRKFVYLKSFTTKKAAIKYYENLPDELRNCGGVNLYHTDFMYGTDDDIFIKSVYGMWLDPM